MLKRGFEVQKNLISLWKGLGGGAEGTESKATFPAG
jgi:hypothetical protein